MPHAQCAGRNRQCRKIKVLPSNLPAKAMTAVEPIYGNEILYFEARGPASGEFFDHTPVKERCGWTIRRWAALASN